jgi:GNAT superfamily N-acetyltransferase
VFAPAVRSHWLPAEMASAPPGQFRVVIDASMPPERSLSLLELVDGPSLLTVTPACAQQLGVEHGDTVPRVELASRIGSAGIELNGPDHLFYLPIDESARLRDQAPAAGTRQLTAADADAFARFTAEAPVGDVDDAFVELDHWLVYGSFVDDRLVAAASMYPWRGSRLADVGILTLPAYRGRGLATRTVRAICAAAIAEGYEPQYRCQLDHAASIGVATAAGFERFGDWDVMAADD